MNPTEQISAVFSAEELFWGITLVAATMILHGYGMLLVLYAKISLNKRIDRFRSVTLSLAPLVIASWIILVTHLVEVMVWGAFFFASGAVPNLSNAYYYALNQYTTLGSDLRLPFHWRLVGSMAAIAGLMTFAWSTGVLWTMAMEFETRQVKLFQHRDKAPLRSGHDD